MDEKEGSQGELTPVEEQRDGLGRRDLLGAGSAALVTAMLAAQSGRGQSIQNIAKAEQDASASNPGPENPASATWKQIHSCLRVPTTC